MLLKKYGYPLLFLVSLVLLYKSTDRILVAKTVSRPGASFSYILKTSVHPKYQIATPHRSPYTHLKAALLPSVLACTTCNYLLPKPACYDNCPPQMGCQCPNCTASGGCTIYVCTQVTVAKVYCYFSNGTTPCTSCEYDRTKNCS